MFLDTRKMSKTFQRYQTYERYRKMINPNIE